MDESIPLTKYTLENLLGVKLDDAGYRRYFSCFRNAQWARKPESVSDQLKRQRANSPKHRDA